VELENSANLDSSKNSAKNDKLMLCNGWIFPYDKSQSAVFAGTKMEAHNPTAI